MELVGVKKRCGEGRGGYGGEAVGTYAADGFGLIHAHHVADEVHAPFDPLPLGVCCIITAYSAKKWPGEEETSKSFGTRDVLVA